MAKKGVKTQTGEIEKCTVLQLQPVKYSISLYYFGANYIKRNKRNYRCKFELKDVASQSLENLPQTIPNVVRGQAVDHDSRDAADPEKPPKKPNSDKTYKLVITDNHTLPEKDEKLLGNTGFHNGNRWSRPEFYKKPDINWMRDVTPATPFRIVVRKFCGFYDDIEQVDLEETLKVIIALKDPPEEFGQHAGPDNGPIKIFQKDFFEKYNQNSEAPDPGNDNSLTWFKGQRKPNNTVITRDIIKKIPYVKSNTPQIPKQGSISFNSLGGVQSHNQTASKFALKNVVLEDGGRKVKVGVADFAFCPLPVGGDNYRFLLNLVDDSDKDIRDTKINGADVMLLDDQNKVIPKPRAYCTGRFIIWRHVDVRLLLVANGLPNNDIVWDTIRGYYNSVFTEIGDPITTSNLSIAGWKAGLRAEFPGQAGLINSLTNVEYQVGIFPAVAAPHVTSGSLMSIANHILKQAVKALNRAETPEFRGLTADKRNIKQTGEGLYVLYLRNNAAASLGGAWLGDGKLLVCKQAVPPAPINVITAHEMAHGFFLRHAHTQKYSISTHTFTVNYLAAGAVAAGRINLIDPNWNCFPEDHDQDYAYKCIMSYLELEQFCGACALSLRFFDRVEIQKTTRFQDRMMKGFFVPGAPGPKIVQKVDVGANTFQLRESIRPLGHAVGNNEYQLMAIGPQKQFTLPNIGAVTGRLNLSCAHKRPKTLWSSSNNAVLEVTNVANHAATVKAKTAGNATITYRRNGRSVSSPVITVT